MVSKVRADSTLSARNLLQRVTRLHHAINSQDCRVAAGRPRGGQWLAAQSGSRAGGISPKISVGAIRICLRY